MTTGYVSVCKISRRNNMSSDEPFTYVSEKNGPPLCCASKGTVTVTFRAPLRAAYLTPNVGATCKDLYRKRKAETCVPDNINLKERITEIEWAVTQGTEFQPSLRRPKTKRRARRTTQARVAPFSRGPALNTVPEGSANGDESNEEEVVVSLLGGDLTDHLPQRGGKVVEATFGLEPTNNPNQRGPGVAAYANGEVVKLLQGSCVVGKT
ncbi:hypothetical protein BJV78DRAFT_1155120 [Lactifluus subvellereus]|nr:hypothetical protein BJV78DRAFT_1155120 [Lactifluus subvellereus]